MCVIIGELSNKLVTIRDSANRPQRYTKIEVLVSKIFFVDRNDKEDFPELMEDWEKTEPEDQEYWDDEEDDMPFNLLLELLFYDVYSEYLMQRDGLLFNGMTAILTEAMSKKKIKAAGFKEKINGWIKLYSGIMKYMPRESVTERGDAEDKAQLMRAITDTVKSNEIGRQSDKGGYLLSAISCLC